MNRLATGTAVALAPPAKDDGLAREVPPAETEVSKALSPSIPVASGHRSERVMSLLLALEALRAEPEVLRTPPNPR